MNELQAFVQLGKFLQDDSTFERCFKPVLSLVSQKNPWFIPDFVKRGYENIVSQLHEPALIKLIDSHHFTSSIPRKRVAVVAHSDSPFNPFFDMLYVLLSGNDYLGKRDDSDNILTPALALCLCDIDAEFSERITFTEQLTDFDAVIIDETPTNALLCKHLQRFPHIIRPQCHSTAVLNGHETEAQLRALAQDIYYYFGRGAFAVSELYVPRGYDFVPLLHLLNEESQPIAMNNHFLNHLDYQKAIRLMNKQFYMDAGTFLFIEQDDNKTAEHTPGIVHYRYYDNLEDTLSMLLSRNNIQNIVTEAVAGKKYRPFAQAYARQIHNFTAGQDILHFLEQLS